MKQNIDKQEALARIVRIMAKYQVTLQDISDELKKLLVGRKEA